MFVPIAPVLIRFVCITSNVRMNPRISSSPSPRGNAFSMAIALPRTAPSIVLACAVRTILFSRASRGTGSRAISPLRSMSPRTLHDVDRVMPNRRSTSCGNTPWSTLHARYRMMSMLTPLNPSASRGLVTARYRLMALCNDRMARPGGVLAPYSQARVNSGSVEFTSALGYIVTKFQYNTLHIQLLHMQQPGASAGAPMSRPARRPRIAAGRRLQANWSHPG